jgi:uncharacterized protein with von Willebrand factor type A (vWA) domain
VVLRGIVVFGRLLRDAGLEVGTDRITLATAALDRVSVADRDDFYWTLRQTLVSRRDDLAAFDHAFQAWFDRIPVDDTLSLEGQEADPAAFGRGNGSADGGGDADEWSPGWTDDELLRHKDFATLTDEEFARLRTLMRVTRSARPLRRTRRRRIDAHGDVLDLRRLVRRSLATAGEPIHPTYRGRRHSPRKLVVLCDVSGSMDPYARALLLFIHALITGGPGVEAFAFGTRLTRLTHQLRTRDTEHAFAAAAARAVDWSAGTRIGACLKEYNDEWGRRSLTRGAIVIILSDGWERGDTALVAKEMARLRRAAYAVVWVNPLKGHPGYEPLAAGMRAALPYVDRFVSGHNSFELGVLAEIIRTIQTRHLA